MKDKVVAIIGTGAFLAFLITLAAFDKALHESIRWEKKYKKLDTIFTKHIKEDGEWFNRTQRKIDSLEVVLISKDL